MPVFRNKHSQQTLKPQKLRGCIDSAQMLCEVACRVCHRLARYLLVQAIPCACPAIALEVEQGSTNWLYDLCPWPKQQRCFASVNMSKLCLVVSKQIRWHLYGSSACCPYAELPAGQTGRMRCQKVSKASKVRVNCRVVSARLTFAVLPANSTATLCRLYTHKLL